MLTEIGGGSPVMVTVATSDLVLSATALAVSTTVAGLGTTFGAVYVIDIPDTLDIADSVPQFAPLHPAPETDQLIPLFWLSPDTVAVIVVLAPVWIEKARGVTVTETAIVPPLPPGSLDPQEARKKLPTTTNINFLRLLNPVISAEIPSLLWLYQAHCSQRLETVLLKSLNHSAGKIWWV